MLPRAKAPRDARKPSGRMRSALVASLALGLAVIAACSPPAPAVALPSQFVGTFGTGNSGLGSQTVEIAADGRFTLTEFCCTGGSNTSGIARLEGDVLVLSDDRDWWEPQAEPARSRHRLYAVPWGTRTCLVRDDRMTLFCNAVNNGDEPRTGGAGLTWLRAGDEALPAPGLPRVPEPWRPFLLTRRLEALTVEAVEERGAWVELGTRDGLLEGLTLVLHDVPTEQRVVDLGAPPFQDKRLRIVRLEARRSLVQTDYGGAEPQPIASGLLVSCGVDAAP